jgi:hypothetical protein
MAWNDVSQFWPDWNGLEWWESVLARLEWLGPSEISFGLTGMIWNGGSGCSLTETAWNGGCGFWPDWNGLEWRKSVLVLLEWLGIEEVGFGLTGMTWNDGSGFWSDWNGLE